jgi:hypothetical protein
VQLIDSLMEDDTEIDIINCAECGQPIETRWMKNGRGMLPGEYLLVADWIFHPNCWDSLVDRSPP